MRRQKQAAFTLFQAIAVAVCIGVLAAIAVPRLNQATVSKRKAAAAARKIVTALRRARALAIANAPTNTQGFGLRMTGGPGHAGYDILNLKTMAAADSHTIDPKVSCTGGATFDFGPLGNLSSSSDTVLHVDAQGKHFTISVVRATGAVKCLEN
ncbi:MAG: pilus assembly FimT family protein [Planctomycetota bacterium]|jgi:Tfp pilus assembly protein FimT